jgi:hypothetical protein
MGEGIGNNRAPGLFHDAVAADRARGVQGLFIIDLIIPDFIPFADEILLGLVSLLLAGLKKRDGQLEAPQEPGDGQPNFLGFLFEVSFPS